MKRSPKKIAILALCFLLLVALLAVISRFPVLLVYIIIPALIVLPLNFRLRGQEKKILDTKDIVILDKDNEESLLKANKDNVAGNSSAAMEGYKKLAEAGFSQGYVGIGNIYYKWSLQGFFFERKNAPLAFENFMKAAEMGSYAAMTAAGEMLIQGKGCQKNREEAKKWLKKAADAGYAPAIKALQDHFEVSMVATVSDKDYNAQLEKFCAFTEKGLMECADVYRHLILGTDEQLIRLGYRLAVGCHNRSKFYNAIRFNQYELSAYFNTFRPPLLSTGRIAEPVRYDTGVECVVVIIDRRGLGDRPLLTFARDRGGIGSGRIGVKAVGTAQYDTADYQWLKDTREADVIEVVPWTPEEMETDMRAYAQFRRWHPDRFMDYLKNLDIQSYESVLFLIDEKDYSYELGHIVGDSLNILWRYSDYPAKEIPAKVTNLKINI